MIGQAVFRQLANGCATNVSITRFLSQVCSNFPRNVARLPPTSFSVSKRWATSFGNGLARTAQSNRQTPIEADCSGPDRLTKLVRCCVSVDGVVKLVEEVASADRGPLNVQSMTAILDRLVIIGKLTGEDGSSCVVEQLAKGFLITRVIADQCIEILPGCTWEEFQRLARLWADIGLLNSSSLENESLRAVSQKLLQSFTNGIWERLAAPGARRHILTSKLPKEVIRAVALEQRNVEVRNASLLLFLLSRGGDMPKGSYLDTLVEAVKAHACTTGDLAVTASALFHFGKPDLAGGFLRELTDRLEMVDAEDLVNVVEACSASSSDVVTVLFRRLSHMWCSGKLRTRLDIGQQAAVLLALRQKGCLNLLAVRHFFNSVSNKLGQAEDTMLVSLARLLCSDGDILRGMMHAYDASMQLQAALECRALANVSPKDRVLLLMASLVFQPGRIGKHQLSSSLLQQTAPFFRKGLPQLTVPELCVFCYIVLPLCRNHNVIVTSECWIALGLALDKMDSLQLGHISKILYGLLRCETRISPPLVDRFVQRARRVLVSPANGKTVVDDLPQLVDVLGWTGRSESKVIASLLDDLVPVVPLIAKQASSLSIMNQGLRNLSIINVPLLQALARYAVPMFDSIKHNLHTVVNLYGIFAHFGVKLPDLLAAQCALMESREYRPHQWEDCLHIMHSCLLFNVVPKKTIKSLLESPSIFSNGTYWAGCSHDKVRECYCADVVTGHTPDKWALGKQPSIAVHRFKEILYTCG